MKPTFIGLIFFKSKTIVLSIRILFYKLRGLKIGKGTVLGMISCDWPHLVRIGSNCEIQDDVHIKLWHPYSNENYIKFGDNVFIGERCTFSCASKITIGNDCLIASGTTIIDGSHEFKKGMKVNKQPSVISEIIISDDVWIGMSCSILLGVTIGTGSVIAAGSVVTTLIPENEVWGGVPAKFIKKRT